MRFLIALLVLLVCSPVWAGVKFNGDADMVSYTQTVSGPPLAIHAVVKLTTVTASNQGVASWASSGRNDCYFNLVHGEDDNNFPGWNWQARETGSTPESSGFAIAYVNSISDTEWHTVLGVSETTSSHKIYVDGVLQDTSTTSSDVCGTTDTIAAGALARSSAVYWDPNVSEIAVWEGGTALDAQDAAILASGVKGAALQVKPSNLVLYWSMDEVSGGTSGIGSDTFKDLSGNGNDGTGQDADGDSTYLSEEFLSYPY